MYTVQGQPRGIRSLESLVGHRQQIFISGPDGVGKKLAAVQSAQSILCSGDRSTSCACKSCRLFSSNAHPDFLFFKCADIGVNEIREDLVDRIGHLPTLGKYVCVLSDVDCLSVAASNGLLKTLEEPPPYVTFFLTSSDLSRVPSAVLSRCSRVEFQLLPLSIIEHKLLALGAKDKAPLLARMSEGSLGLAIKCWGSGQLKLRDEALELLKMRSKEDIASVLGVVSDIDKDNLEFLLRWLIQISSDAVLVSPRIHKDLDLSFLDRDDMFILYRKLVDVKRKIGSVTLANALKAALVVP